MRRTFLVSCCLLWLAVAASLTAAEPTPVGMWKTINDKTGKPRGLVRLYEQHGEIFGKIEVALIPEEVNERCDRCTDERKGQPFIGMVILRHLQKHGEEYSGGDILDPDTGSIYRCRLRLAEGGKKLLVRGYLGLSLFGRTQTWIRRQ